MNRFQHFFEIIKIFDEIEISNDGTNKIVEDSGLVLACKCLINSFFEIRLNTVGDKSELIMLRKPIFSVEDIRDEPNSVYFS